MLGKFYTSWIIPQPRHSPLTMIPGQNLHIQEEGQHRTSMDCLLILTKESVSPQGSLCIRLPVTFYPPLPSYLWMRQLLTMWALFEPCLALLTFFLHPFIHHFSDLYHPLCKEPKLFLPLSLFWIESVYSYTDSSLDHVIQKQFLNFRLTQKLQFLQNLNTMASKNLHQLFFIKRNCGWV